MADQNPSIAEPVVKTEAETAPTEPVVNWESKYQEDMKKFEGHETYRNVAENSYNFFEKYPELKKGYQEWVSGKEWKPNFVQPEDKKDSKFDPEAFRNETLELARKEARRELEPIQRATQEREAKEEEKYAKEKYGFTDAEYADLDKRFAKKCEEEIKDRVYRGENRAEATEKVRSGYERFSIDSIIALLMPEKMASSIRKPPQLAPGMTTPGNNAGPSPKVLDQAKKEYADSPKGEASAGVVKKWAEQFGQSMGDTHKLLMGE